MQIPVNNALFDCKNDDIGPKAGLILPIISSFLDRWLGPTFFSLLFGVECEAYSSGAKINPENLSNLRNLRNLRIYPD